MFKPKLLSLYLTMTSGVTHLPKLVQLCCRGVIQGCINRKPTCWKQNICLKDSIQLNSTCFKNQRFCFEIVQDYYGLIFLGGGFCTLALHSVYLVCVLLHFSVFLLNSMHLDDPTLFSFFFFSVVVSYYSLRVSVIVITVMCACVKTQLLLAWLNCC